MSSPHFTGPVPNPQRMDDPIPYVLSDDELPVPYVLTDAA